MKQRKRNVDFLRDKSLPLMLASFFLFLGALKGTCGEVPEISGSVVSSSVVFLPIRKNDVARINSTAFKNPHAVVAALRSDLIQDDTPAPRVLDPKTAPPWTPAEDVPSLLTIWEPLRAPFSALWQAACAL